MHNKVNYAFGGKKLNKFKNQTGAMFGMDARITLIIFGALAAVTGAMMSNIAPEANTTALATDLTNIAKGYESYVLDTSKNPSYLDKPNRSKENFLELLNDDSYGWQGPYLALSSEKHPKYGSYGLIEGEFNTPGAPPITPCASGNACVVWVKLTEIPSELALSIDKKMDGEEGYDKGRVRIVPQGKTDDIYYMIARKQSR